MFRSSISFVAIAQLFASSAMGLNFMDCDPNSLILGQGLQSIRCRLTQAPTSDVMIRMASQALQFANCTITFNQNTWNEYHTITVRPLPSFAGGAPSLFPGQARPPTAPPCVLNFYGFGNDPFFNNQRATVIGQLNMPPQIGSTCTVSGGPNYRTFSGEQFSNMNPGVFTLLSTNRVTVQVLQVPDAQGFIRISGVSVTYGNNAAVYDVRDWQPGRICQWRMLNPNNGMNNVQFTANPRNAMMRLPCGTTILITNNVVQRPNTQFGRSLGVMVALAPGHSSQQGICVKPVGVNPSVFVPIAIAPSNANPFAGQMIPTVLDPQQQFMMVCNPTGPTMTSPQPALPPYIPPQLPPLPTQMPLPNVGCDVTNPSSPCYNLPPGGCNPFQPNSLCPLPQGCDPLQVGSPCYLPICSPTGQPIQPGGLPGVLPGIQPAPSPCVVTQTASPTLIVYPTGFTITVTTTSFTTTTSTQPILGAPTGVPCDTNIPGNPCISTSTITSTSTIYPIVMPTQQPPLGQPPLGQPPLGQPPLGQPPLGQPPLGMPPLGMPPFFPLPSSPQQPPLGIPPLPSPTQQPPLGIPPLPSPTQQPPLDIPPFFPLPSPTQQPPLNIPPVIPLPSPTQCNPNIPGSGCYIPPAGTPGFLMGTNRLSSLQGNRVAVNPVGPQKANLVQDKAQSVAADRRPAKSTNGQAQAGIRKFCQKALALPGCTSLVEYGFYVDACVVDVLAAGTYDVSEAVKHDFSMACQTLSQFGVKTRVNGTNSRNLLDSDLGNATSTNGTCPKTCSNRGKCFEYGCLCDVGYGGIDCSISVSSLPSLTRNGRIRNLGEFDISALNVERADMILSSSTSAAPTSTTDVSTMTLSSSTVSASLTTATAPMSMSALTSQATATLMATVSSAASTLTGTSTTSTSTSLTTSVTSSSSTSPASSTSTTTPRSLSSAAQSNMIVPCLTYSNVVFFSLFIYFLI